jgi:NADPH2:quinone reductase
MPKAVRVHVHGGPEALVYEDVDSAAPGAGEVLVRHTAIGLNFLDAYFRSGLYPAPQGLPVTPGGEGAGVVTEVGAGVTTFKAGDRVAYTTAVGAYCEERVLSADKLVKIPDGVSDEQAAALMLKGLTAEYLLRRTYAVKPGETILFHAAAGGVGLIAGQWAKHLGATVIGTVGNDEKAALARAHGCDHPVVYTRESFVERVKSVAGEGVHAVYESIGKDTFAGSLESLRPLGVCASYGWASGPIPPFDPAVLGPKSLVLTYARFSIYNRERAALLANAREVFNIVQSGGVKVEIRKTFALKDAATAHRALESRQTVGSNILLP